MSDPLIDALHERAVCAYQRADLRALPGLRALGAVLALHGIAENGGLVGGAVENLFSTDDLRAVDDAVAGLLWLDLPDVAALITRAREEYLRFRPTGQEEISPADALLWEQLDADFFEVAPTTRLEQAVRTHLAEIAPELVTH
ncbi:hypothetical protein [Quadrisphaera sp. INWT6]|uniref:DMP19 family protein n=1 Tax=Quadrisphaera sp. INWT6 TaxID=2596917 RepID=UPI001891FFFA|nr:hypothetical protein [Quadrisphaera sp. INWT6]MBF5082676.1 hypothetical protein [Quadrisphaera sp. INWT6]